MIAVAVFLPAFGFPTIISVRPLFSSLAYPQKSGPEDVRNGYVQRGLCNSVG
jgi:hypothetical protein